MSQAVGLFVKPIHHAPIGETSVGDLLCRNKEGEVVIVVRNVAKKYLTRYYQWAGGTYTVSPADRNGGKAHCDMVVLYVKPHI